MWSVRPAAVAGSFYPGHPRTLAATIASHLQSVHPSPEGAVPKAVIVPHAGYIYSGPVAASAFARVAAGRNVIRRVVLLGPIHRVPLWGLALAGVDAFETPLGEVRLDREALADLDGLPQVALHPAAHALEHSLEVQLPFLQTVLEDFLLVPLGVGEAGAEEVAGVLERLWGGPETLIVVSSDLSHGEEYSEAKAKDAETARQIEGLGPPLDPDQACGGRGINGLLLVARRLHLRVQRLDLRNSGDTAGERSRVVGYGAFAFEEGHHGR